MLAGPARQLKYVLRAYDPKEHFDETDARPLWLYHEALPGNLVKSDTPSSQALLAAYEVLQALHDRGVLELMRVELYGAMQQVGAPSIKHLVPAMVRRA